MLYTQSGGCHDTLHYRQVKLYSLVVRAAAAVVNSSWSLYVLCVLESWWPWRRCNYLNLLTKCRHLASWWMWMLFVEMQRTWWIAAAVWVWNCGHIWKLTSACEFLTHVIFIKTPYHLLVNVHFPSELVGLLHLFQKWSFIDEWQRLLLAGCPPHLPVTEITVVQLPWIKIQWVKWQTVFHIVHRCPDEGGGWSTTASLSLLCSCSAV